MDQLFTALYQNDLKTIKRLLARGADIDTTDRAGRTILCYAVADMKMEIAVFLIEHGANVNIRDKHGFTPLHGACQNDDLPMVQLLVEHHAEINVQNKFGNTPLDLTGNSSLFFDANLP